MKRLEGKTAIITGGNSGVGEAAALLFAREGANVVISARRKDALDAVAEKIAAEGGSVLAVATDISKNEDCVALMKAAVEKPGGIHAVHSRRIGAPERGRVHRQRGLRRRL